MEIICENPVVIFHPDLLFIARKSVRVVFDIQAIEFKYVAENRFPWKLFYSAKARVTKDNIEQFYFVLEDGDISPIFMMVPCGHCRLCRQKWLSDWQTRCICESACHPYKPLFLTLTYAPEYRPDNMTDVYLDFDVFMKRFRCYVDRVSGKKNSLRYVASSEWTPKNHYPHIHMLVWGLPYICSTDDGISNFQALNDFIAKDCWQLGFVKTEVCRDPSGKYGLKYIRKQEYGDCWFHASRRNGIGFDYAKRLLPFVLKNPDMSSISLTVFGKSYSNLAIPEYFKRVWFPTVSVVFPAKIVKAAKEFHESVVILSEVARYKALRSRLGIDALNISFKTSLIADKFEDLKIDFFDVVPDRDFQKVLRDVLSTNDALNKVSYVRQRERYDVLPQLDSSGRYLVPRAVLTASDDTLIPKLVETPRFFRSNKYYLFRHILMAKQRFLESFKILSKFQFSSSYIKERLAKTSEHKQFITSNILKFGSSKSVNSQLHKYTVDERWISEHWSNIDPIDAI